MTRPAAAPGGVELTIPRQVSGIFAPATPTTVRIHIPVRDGRA